MPEGLDVDEWLALYGGEDLPPRPVKPARRIVGVSAWLAEHGDEELPPRPARATERQQRRQARAAEIAAGASLTVEEWIRATNGERRRRTPAERRALFERDGWVCGLCGGMTGPRESASSPDLAAVLDHIMPLRPDDPDVPIGLDTDDNVQCAHRLCNLSKHNRVGWRAAFVLNPVVDRCL